MKPIKGFERESRSTVSWVDLLSRYEDATLSDMTPYEAAFLFGFIKQLLTQQYHNEKTIERLQKDIADIVHLRDALPHWHKVHDEAMALRKKVQELETQIRGYEAIS